MSEKAGNPIIRDYKQCDLAPLHAINVVSEPGVGSVSRQELHDLVSMSVRTLVVYVDDDPVAFILIMAEGLDYQSLNYRWISERYDRFAYVDRIAVHPEHRGTGLGRALYQAAFNALAGTRELLLCEVNLEPPNPGSLRFHQSLGFRQVGERWLPDRTKGVVYLRRDL